MRRDSNLTEETSAKKLKELIGRRKTEDGKVTWISQTKWEDEQRKLEAERGRGMFAFQLDDSEKKGKIVISSPALVAAVRRMIPPILLESVSDGITIEEPFAPLFHFMDDIREDMISHDADAKDLEDIKALEYFLYECQPQYKNTRAALDTGRTALVSFETLWGLFKVGDLIVAVDKFEEKSLFKFTQLVEQVDTYSGRKGVCVALSVVGWCIGWDKEQKCFTQKSYTFNIRRFLGNLSVRSLPVYPLRYEEDETQKSLLADLEKRGRRWAQLASNTPCCFDYDGIAIETFHTTRNGLERDTQLNGRILLDHWRQSSLDEMFATEMECNYRAIIEEKLVDTPTGAAKTLTKAEHFILCPPTLGCFHVSSSRRYGINITRLKPTEWSEDAMNSLIMDENKKTRLKCLVRNYTSGRIKGGDIIKNKGRGLTIVLYGPSGVGKTLTAECLAEYAKTPVIPLSVGNLVTDEDMIEDRLREAFSTASRLKAILLLDEADVVLEARSFEDVRRNGIVSIFLRQLEYYSGILILTTNRITSIDPAFQSRIQIALPYEELIPTQREQIWKSLMNAILVDVTDLDRVVIERELPRLSEYPLNGRQIRNTLQLSMLLASDDLSTEGRVQLKHIKQAMKEALEFQEFFEETKKDYSNKNRVWKPFMPLQNGVSR